MTETVEVYWSFRSPYSYLVTPDLLRLRDDYDVDVDMRIVYPIAIRDPSLVFDPANRDKSRYIVRDSRRRAEFLGMPFLMPARPDPIVQDNATMAVAEEQPYIHRLSALGVEAQRRGKGLELVAEVSALIFGGTDGWDQGDHLKDAVARAGLDLPELEAAITDGDQLEEVALNQEALSAAGHWGVPTMVLQGEPFFGQDRIDTLRWRLDQLGVV
ncbi:MAG: DsbA family protein [Pseudomonadales bacterium]|nr:DsbA family protein [Pseudomonadales bacterium]MBO6597127.1 DsbA family protein [Pseudomonadales bacterium]MBO6823686.1 DsbA family protein [Pseudomonadales bacterium]